MKKLILITTLLLSFNINAQATKMDYCNNLASVAESTMTTRQSGVSLSNQLAILEGIDKDIKKIFQAIILEAYETPQFSGEKYRKRAVVNFQDSILLRCLKQN